MLDYLSTKETLHVRNVLFDEKQYQFVMMVAFGEDESVAYALAYDAAEFKRVCGTDDEESFLYKCKKNADVMLQQQECQHLLEYLKEQLRSEIQKQAREITDFKFSAEDIVQMLSNLLAKRSENLEEASVRDITALIRELASQGALEGGDGFQRHFVTVYPHFNALCSNCNREMDIAKGLSCTCPFCGAKYTWSEDEQKYYPEPLKL